MATTEILASGTTELASSDIVLTDGQVATVFLKSRTGALLPAGLQAAIQVKTAGAVWHTIGVLDSQNFIRVIDAAGTYRIFRPVSQIAFGADRG